MITIVTEYWSTLFFREFLGKKSLLDGKDNFHYPTMSQDELKAIDVQSLCAENCIMFMWCVSPKLDEAIELLKYWGFKYCTIGFVWDKQKTNPGAYTMSAVEICIIGRKGNIPTPRGVRNVKQFLSLPRGKHSQKPLEIRNRIERMFPEQSKLEMFARSTTKGWDVYSNELENDTDLKDDGRKTFDGLEKYFE